MTRKLIAIVAFVLVATATLEAQEIKWMTFDQAIAAQKKKPKKYFIDVYTNLVWTLQNVSEQHF